MVDKKTGASVAKDTAPGNIKQPPPTTAVSVSADPGGGEVTERSTTTTPSPRERWREIGLKASREYLQTPRNRSTSPIKANGSVVTPDIKRQDSLTVPGGKLSALQRKQSELIPGDSLADVSGHGDRASGSESRRSSARSVDSKASNVDLSRLQNAPVVQAKKDEEEKGKTTIQTDDWYIRSVIPYLPQWLAVTCLLLNVFIPGSGTMISGLSIFCCGKPRVNTKEDHRMITLCVNCMVGSMQLFTVPFMLVGWFWSLVWGIYMLILAAEHKEEEKQQREKELQAKALTALNANLRPWTLMRS